MSSSTKDPYAFTRSLWLSNGLPPKALSNLHLSEKPDPAVDSSFKLGTAAQTSIGLSALSATQFHELRTGVSQQVTVDARHAVLEFQSERWYIENDQLNASANTIWDPIAGLYKTKDDSYVRIHTNFPHHRQGILDILQCEPTRESVQRAMLQWNAVEFETEAASRKMCATALRSFGDWDKHPQGLALANTPPVTIAKIGDAPKRVVDGRKLDHPLQDIRVLDLSRVLAGPICGRTLAMHGADVLLITSPNLPSLTLDVDTSRGKRTTQLDLNQAKDKETLLSLAKESDVFLQAYRPGGLEAKGFGAEELARMRPGIVYASLTAYGWEGPWKDRRGFDSLTQTASGFNHAEAEAYMTFNAPSDIPSSPKPLPMQALDHAAAYLLAFGINTALCKTMAEGGSWEVRVSLAAVGQWIRSFGRLSPEAAFKDGKPMPPRTFPQDPELAALAVRLRQSRGDFETAAENGSSQQFMTAIGHAANLEKTPVIEIEAPMTLNRHKAAWNPRESDVLEEQ